MTINVDIRRANLRVSTGRAQVVEDIGGLPERPRNHAECRSLLLGTVRPCPWIGCVYHLALDVSTIGGGITFSHPDHVDADGVPDVESLHSDVGTCALGAATKHPDGLTLEDVGEIMNLTRERVRQIEAAGLHALRSIAELVRWQDAEAGE